MAFQTASRAQSPEWRALIALTGPGSFLPDASVNWKALIDLAIRHKVCLLLAHGLRQSGTAISCAEAQVRMDAATRTLTMRALAHARLITGIIEAFHDARVPVSILKGAPLSSIIHGDLTRRDPGDIDMIIPPERLLDACNTLSALGFSTEYAKLFESEIKRKNLVRYMKDLGFAHRDRAAYVECHWRLFPHETSIQTDPARIFGADTVLIGDRAIPVPDPVETFLHLCCHGAWHLWERLKWLNDIRWIVHTGHMVSGDWNPVVTRAQEMGLTRVLASTVLVAHRIGEPFPLPAALQEVIGQTKGAQRDADTILAHLARTGPLAKDPEPKMFALMALASKRIRMCSGNRSNVPATLMSDLVRPSYEELIRIDLPAPLHGLYALFRTLRVMRSQMGIKR